MYRVISPFRDLKNDEPLYQEGDMYPVEGYKPTKARIKELAEGKNPLNRVFIVKDTTEETPGDSTEGEPEKDTTEETSETNERKEGETA